MGASNIAEKVVVITGASSGIGESTAKLPARHGARLVLAGVEVVRLQLSPTRPLRGMLLELG